MARGERKLQERIDPGVKEREKGVKENRGERKETEMNKSLHINVLNSFFPSPHHAGNRFISSLSLLSLFHPPARICPRVRFFVCVREGGVKRERKERNPPGRMSMEVA